MKLSTKILIAMVLGILWGLLSQFYFPESLSMIINDRILFNIGKIFLNLIQLVMVPIIFTSIITGITSFDDISKVKKYGSSSFIMYIITAVISISITFLLAYLLKPGIGIDLNTADLSTSISNNFTFSSVVNNLVPKNIFLAMSSGNIIQIIIIAILLSLSIIITGEKSKPLKNFFLSVYEVIQTMTMLIINLSPIAVFSLLAYTISSYGLGLLLPLLKYMVGIIILSLIQVLIIYPLFIKLVAKTSPVKVLRDIFPAVSMAFGTSSTAAALPIVLDCMKSKVKIHESMANFLVPLGTTFKKDGAAIFHGFTAIFIAQIFGIDLSFSQLITLFITIIIVTLSSAGIPGAAIVMLSVVLKSAGLPLEGIALIAGIDRLTDPFRSMVNVIGNVTCTTSVVKIHEKS